MPPSAVVSCLRSRAQSDLCCDREADIYDYLAYKLSHGERFVVRAKHLRAVEEANA